MVKYLYFFKVLSGFYSVAKIYETHSPSIIYHYYLYGCYAVIADNYSNFKK